MFSRSKAAAAPADEAVTPVGATPAKVTSSDGAPETSSGKGRPTPKRKEAQAANKRPLVPNDRKKAAKAQREQRRMERERTTRALETGDERYMPLRDKGAQRRYVREFVDARWNLGEYFLPIAFVFLFATFFTQSRPEIGVLVLLGLYGYLFLTLIDVTLMWRSLKKRLVAKFGPEVPSGTMMYAVTRAYQIRRSRLPRPLHKKHGQYPV